MSKPALTTTLLSATAGAASAGLLGRRVPGRAPAVCAVGRGGIRLRAAKFGATPEDWIRLRLTVQTPCDQPKEQPAGPSDLAARRRNLQIAG